MEQERKTQNEKANTKNNNAGEAGNADEQNMKQSSERGKSKGGPEDIVTYNEGQYQEGTDKPTMSPGSSDAEINPSAKHNNKDENG